MVFLEWWETQALLVPVVHRELRELWDPLDQLGVRELMVLTVHQERQVRQDLMVPREPQDSQDLSVGQGVQGVPARRETPA